MILTWLGSTDLTLYVNLTFYFYELSIGEYRNLKIQTVRKLLRLPGQTMDKAKQ